MTSLHGLLNCEIGGLDCHVITTEYRTRVHCIFNSKTLFKDKVSLKLIFPGAIHTCKHILQLFIHIYKTKQVHQNITGKHNLHFHTKHKHSYLTYTMYIQFMTHSIINE